MNPNTFDFYRCSRCGLVWAAEPGVIPKWCPDCRHWHSIPKEPIVLMGRDVTVMVMRDYGLNTGLLNPATTRRLSTLKLFNCTHGWIEASMCDECGTAGK